MADEYDPLDPPTFDAANEEDDNYDPSANMGQEGEDDDGEEEYDPSSYGLTETVDQNPNAPEQSANTSAQPSQRTSRAPSAIPNANEQSAKPKTVGGFIMEESDDEEEAHATPAPSQLNGTRGAQSGLGAAAVSEAKDVTLSSEPTPDAVAASTAHQNNGLTGSTAAAPTSASLPAPVSSIDSHTPVPSAVTAQTVAADAGSMLSPSAQPSAAPTPLPKPADGMDTSVPSQAAASVPQRLAHDKVGQLEDRIKDDPKADTDAWMSLIAHYKEKDQTDNVRKVYERFFSVFPTAGKVWLDFANFEQDNDETVRVEQILGLALSKVLDIRMWHFYLNFLRRRNPLISDPDGSRRALISQVFEVVLDKVGIDPEAGELWVEYIDFVKSGPGSISGSGWQDLQKVDLLRKAYQRAIAVPHENLIRLWKEYDNFEIGLNRATGRKNLNDQGASYMTAKSARTQLDSRLYGLDRSSLPRLPPVYGCEGEDEFGDQVEKWREWIRWEVSDELVLKGEEGGAPYRKRVLYVFKQATAALRFYPEMWFDAAAWCFAQHMDEMSEEGDRFLDEGIKAIPESVLLALKKADRVESGLPANTTDEIAIQNGAKIEVVYETNHTALYALRDKYAEREKRALAGVQEHFAQMTPEEEPEKQEEDDEDIDADDKPKSRKELLNEQLKAVKASFDAQRELLKRTISYVWSAKMRAFRRVQGQGVPRQPKKGFRGVFAESRPRGMLTSEVYVASALIEHHCYRDPAATRIFERGLKLFPVDELFALEYIKHLVSINDITNAKVVFETTLTKILNTASLPPAVQKERCRPLLGYMHSFEGNYGDLAQIHKLETRMAEMFPDEPDLLRFSHRFEMPTFDALKAQIVISPSQTRPKPPPGLPTQPIPGGFPGMTSPRAAEMRLGPHGPYLASPKRPLDDSDADTPSRKFMRAESPIKGAAGKRIATGHSAMSATVPVSNTTVNVGSGGASNNGGFVTKNYQPNNVASAPPPVPVQMPPTLPGEVMYLLSLLPPAASYNVSKFDPVKMVQFLRDLPLQGRR